MVDNDQDLKIETEVEETAESLAAHIAELQAKQAKLEAAEDAQEAEYIELPLADVHLALNDKLSFVKKGITPPELLVLVAAHHTNSGGKPVESITPVLEDGKAKTVKVDVRLVKSSLAAKYGKARIETIFPGVNPKFPTKFRAAVNMGLGVVLPGAHLFTQNIKSGEVSNLTPLPE